MRLKISFPILARHPCLDFATSRPLTRPVFLKSIKSCCHFQFQVSIAEDPAARHFRGLATSFLTFSHCPVHLLGASALLVSGWCRTSCNGRSRRLTLHPVSLLTARSRSPTVFDPVPVRLLTPPVANRGLTTAATICFRSWPPSRFPLFGLLACANSSLPGAEYDAATNLLTARKPSTCRAVTFTCSVFTLHAVLGFHLARRRRLSPLAFPHSAYALCVALYFRFARFRAPRCFALFSSTQLSLRAFCVLAYAPSPAGCGTLRAACRNLHAFAY